MAELTRLRRLGMLQDGCLVLLAAGGALVAASEGFGDRWAGAAAFVIVAIAGALLWRRRYSGPWVPRPGRRP